MPAKKKTIPTIDQARLAGIEHLAYGAHEPGKDMNILEAAAYVTGEPWSQAPSSIDPVIAALLLGLNNTIHNNLRADILVPLLPVVIGSAGTGGTAYAKAVLCADRAVRLFAPMALRDGGLEDPAAALEALPELAADTTATILTALAAAKTAAGTSPQTAAAAAAVDKATFAVLMVQTQSPEVVMPVVTAVVECINQAAHAAGAGALWGKLRKPIADLVAQLAT